MLLRQTVPKDRRRMHGHDSLRDCGLSEGTLRVGFADTENRAWTVGRLSMMLLLVVTFTDVAVKFVGLLHKDTINIEKPSLGLGSAAISSITDALGPILPFTGGIDLRRSEYGVVGGNIIDNLSALARQTYGAYANARTVDLENTATVTSQAAGEKTKQKQSSAKKEQRKHVSILGASHPFVSLGNIAQLTLRDMGIIFDYVIKSSQEGFNAARFSNALQPRVRMVIEAMDKAITKSRGKGVKTIKSNSKDLSLGNTDAFLFCGVMRVFAEWRVLRQVPEGYKGYAVGMSLGQKDVVQNVVKIERAAQAWIDHRVETASPTLRDILQHEIDIVEHPNLPRLTETSGAMGLLWVRRQLHYQTAIFGNILDMPLNYSTSKDAVSAAYTEVYGGIHGWAVQKIFNYSFQASPKVEEIFKFMNPHRLEEVKEIARHMGRSASDSTVESISPSVEEPPENFFHRIGWEWDKFANGVGQNIGKRVEAIKRKHRVGVQGSGKGIEGHELEDFICDEMSKDAHDHIKSYLHVAKPLLDDLAGLFEGLNMDDPTKV